MSENDIYNAPSSEIGKEDRTGLQELVFGWERLRLRYNLILFPLGLLTLGAWSYANVAYLPLVILLSVAFGFGANLCYLLGPLAELYFRGLTRSKEPPPWLRTGLFWAGLVLSALVILIFGLLGIGWSTQFAS